MTTKNDSDTTKENQKEDKETSITNTEGEEEGEEYEGRSWNKILIVVAFVLFVVILWYVLSI